MKKVYLSHTRSRYRAGELSYQTPSRFLQEMGNRTRRSDGVRAGKPRSSGPSSVPSLETQDDYYHRDAMPDYDREVDQGAQPRVGEVVEHEFFGRGKIIAISGKGEAKKAVVNFTTVGRKNLLLRYARLKVL